MQLLHLLQVRTYVSQFDLGLRTYSPHLHSLISFVLVPLVPRLQQSLHEMILEQEEDFLSGEKDVSIPE